MSNDLDILRLMLSLARPMATSLSGRGKDSGVFSLGHEGADDGDTGAVGRDGVVERGRVVVVAEAVVASGDASGIWAREDHVGGAENLATVGVGGGVAQ